MAKASFIGTILRFLATRLLPLVILLLAIFMGWCNQSELPTGLFFAVLIPILKGYKPPAMFGHGKMVGTPPVPDDMMPEPRPEHEVFVELPGGLSMPQNGLGMCCRPTAYDDVLVERSVLWYLLLGGRLIDGAHLYLNHEAIGKGIKEAIRRGVPREEIFVTTKVWPSFYGYNSTKSLVPRFLDELGLDYLDMVLMHTTSDPMLPFAVRGALSNECKQQGMTNKECRQATWKALSELRDAGMIRNAGVSNFGVKHMLELSPEEFKDYKVAPIANNQIQWNPWAPQEWVDTVEYAKANGIVITAYNSLGGMQHDESYKIAVLTELATKHSKTVAQIMLRWAIQSQAVVIPGTGNPKYMRENLSVYNFKLSDEEMEQISNLREDTNATKSFFVVKPRDE